ncbi:MAG: hypothetical protein ABI724_16125 [Betaproteobacteria bacterium]
MNARQSQTTWYVSTPTARPGVIAGHALITIRDALAGAWRRWKERNEERRAFDAIADLGEHMLKDIGAPNSLVANAVERREARRLEWINVDLP